MGKSRPKNLNLFTIRFPLPAIVSILHRISGLVLFFIVPFMLWGLHFSLTDIGFDTLQDWFTSFPVHLLIWLLLAPLCYHLVAGIRHLLADVHMGDTLKAGRIGSVLTFVIFIILMVLAGIWLW